MGGGAVVRNIIITLMYHMSHMTDEELVAFINFRLRAICQGFFMTSAVLLGFVARYAHPRVLIAIHTTSDMLKVLPPPASGSYPPQLDLVGMTEFELRLAHCRSALGEDGVRRPHPNMPANPQNYAHSEVNLWEELRQAATPVEWSQGEYWLGSKILLYVVDGVLVEAFPNPTLTASYRSCPDMLGALKLCYDASLPPVVHLSPSTADRGNPLMDLCCYNLLARIDPTCNRHNPPPSVLKSEKCTAFLVAELYRATGEQVHDILDWWQWTQADQELDIANGFDVKAPRWSPFSRLPETIRDLDTGVPLDDARESVFRYVEEMPALLHPMQQMYRHFSEMDVVSFVDAERLARSVQRMDLWGRPT